MNNGLVGGCYVTKVVALCIKFHFEIFYNSSLFLLCPFSLNFSYYLRLLLRMYYLASRVVFPFFCVEGE